MNIQSNPEQNFPREGELFTDTFDHPVWQDAIGVRRKDYGINYFPPSARRARAAQLLFEKISKVKGGISDAANPEFLLAGTNFYASEYPEGAIIEFSVAYLEDHNLRPDLGLRPPVGVTSAIKPLQAEGFEVVVCQKTQQVGKTVLKRTTYSFLNGRGIILETGRGKEIFKPDPSGGSLMRVMFPKNEPAIIERPTMSGAQGNTKEVIELYENILSVQIQHRDELWRDCLEKTRRDWKAMGREALQNFGIGDWHLIK